ncbi:MAG: universal stress protein [Bacteroidota bacterium]|nr:universal stress protein [Bacteroidota bacterium]
MKTILVPTDFSMVSDNAVNYAAEIAKVTKAKLILFHVYQIPVVATEVPIVIPNFEELEKDCLDGLLRISTRLHSKLSTTNIECVVRSGFAVDEINLYAKNNKVDLIVMGMHGAGYLTEKLIGSVTTSLIQRSNCPVLVIDEQVKFKNIKKIVLACDYNETENKKVLEPLKEFAQLFKSHVYVLNVINKSEPLEPVTEVVADFIKLEHSLADTAHSFHYMANEEIVDGINEFVSEQKMDMVVMIPRKHSVLKNIFNEPTTKKMAFHSKAPLLALH